MNRLVRNDRVYSNTTLQIPYDLKMQAKKRGINLSQTFVQALERKIAECGG